MKEVFKEHPSGLYISSLGQVFVPKSGIHKEHYTFGTDNGHGYLIVKYKGKNYLVHRLVAECFIPNPNGYKEVNHKDENKTNNTAENLEWCTRKYNMNYGTRTERVVEKRSKKVLQLTLDGEVVNEWKSAKECVRNGYDNSVVSKCCKNKYMYEGNNIYKGFKWQWANQS